MVLNSAANMMVLQHGLGSRSHRLCQTHQTMPFASTLGTAGTCQAMLHLTTAAAPEPSAGQGLASHARCWGQAKESAAEVVQLQRCFQEAQAQAEAAQQQNRQLLAANADLQARAEESYVQGQAAAAQIAGLQASVLDAVPSLTQSGLSEVQG